MMDRQHKMEHQFFENCRIILAKQFKVPPDDISIHDIIRCAKRAIQNNCKEVDDSMVIEAITKNEQQSLYAFPYGVKIVDMIFAKEYPFCEWADQYQSTYVIDLLNRGFNKKKKKNNL